MEKKECTGWVREGDKAPLFELPNSSFVPVSPLGSTAKVVLSFFPAAFSGSLDRGCECQMRSLDEELSGLTDLGDVAVYGIGRELPFTMAAWADKIGLAFPLLSDANLTVAEAYVGVCSLGDMLATRSRNPGLNGYLSCNRGVVVIEGDTVVYKWVGKNAKTGKPDPSVLPDLGPVKEALAKGKGRL